jgi:uncharacterized membrane protein
MRMKVLCADHIDVAAPVETVFSFVTDISRWPVWISSVVCAEHPEALPVALKEEFLLCLQAGRKRWHERFEVTRLVRNAFLSLEGAYSAARRFDFRFEQRGSHTRLACAIGYPLFGGFMSALLDSAFQRRRVRSELRDSLVRLKGLLEEQVESAVFGDGLVDETPFGAAMARPTAPVQEPAGAL